VATRQWILSLLSAAIMAVLAGCNSGSTFNVQNPPPPAPPNLSIMFQTTPPSSIPVGFTMNLTAVVSNDPNNYGVDWALACPTGIAPGNCGTLSPTHTASGAATTYTAPAITASNSLNGVSIIAYATASHTTNTFASFTVDSFDSTLKPGNYVLQAQGSGNQFAGAITLDGQGNVTAGEQTFNSAGLSITDQGLTGNYFIGNDGRGTITINDPDTAVGVESFALVFPNNSSSQTLISVISGPMVSATGTMVPQTSTAAPSGSYAFVSSGSAVLFPTLPPMPIAFGGVLNIASPSNVSGVADEIFGKTLNANGANGVAISGSFTAVPNDPFGTVTFNLTAPFGPPNTKRTDVNLQFTGYIQDATDIQLIESDQFSGTGFGTTAGLAISQGNTAGTFSNTSLLSGTSYVFGVTGLDLSPNAVNSGSLPYTLTSAGLFQADGNGNVTNGFTDTFLLFNTAQGTNANPQTGAQISAAFDGAYAVASDGRTVVNNLVFTPDPKHGYNPTFFLYLTGLIGAGSPAALVLAAGDTTTGSIYYPSIGTGIAYQQSTAAPVFLGDYGFSFTQQNGSENDGTAQMNANAANTPSASGIADASADGQDNSFLGTFSGPTANVPFPGTLYANPNPTGDETNNVFPLVGTSPMTVDYYFVDQNLGFWIETDLVSEQSGQVSFAFYAARTSLCSGCP
jgi:hypothetical protein